MLSAARGFAPWGCFDLSGPSKGAMISVLVVDDHHLFRDGITRLLRDAAGIELAGSASNGEESIELVNEKQPDVILMDVNMPGMGGLEATQWLR